MHRALYTLYHINGIETSDVASAPHSCLGAPADGSGWFSYFLHPCYNGWCTSNKVVGTNGAEGRSGCDVGCAILLFILQLNVKSDTSQVEESASP